MVCGIGVSLCSGGSVYNRIYFTGASSCCGGIAELSRLLAGVMARGRRGRSTSGCATSILCIGEIVLWEGFVEFFAAYNAHVAIAIPSPGIPPFMSAISNHALAISVETSSVNQRSASIKPVLKATLSILRDIGAKSSSATGIRPSRKSVAAMDTAHGTTTKRSRPRDANTGISLQRLRAYRTAPDTMNVATST